MPIAFDCTCGKAFRVPDEHAGKRTKCPACAAALTVPAAAGSAEDDAFRMLESAEVPDQPARPAPREWAATPRPTVSPPPVAVPAPAPPPKKKPRPVRERREESGGGFQIVLSPAVAGGLTSMAVASVWFFVAWSNDRIAIFAPVVFIFGLVSVVRGFFGAPEE